MPSYIVEAFFDHEAAVWVATSNAEPGLATEAGTVEGLLQKLKIMVPELLAESGKTANVAVEYRD